MITFSHNMPTISEFVATPSPIQYRFDCTWQTGLGSEFSEFIEDHRGYRYYSIIIQNNANADYAASRLDIALAGYVDEDGATDIGDDSDDPSNWFFNSARFTQADSGVDASAGVLANDIFAVPVATDDVLAHIPQYRRIRLRANWRGTLPSPLGANQEAPSAVVLLTLYP